MAYIPAGIAVDRGFAATICSPARIFPGMKLSASLWAERGSFLPCGGRNFSEKHEWLGERGRRHEGVSRRTILTKKLEVSAIGGVEEAESRTFVKQTFEESTAGRRGWRKLESVIRDVSGVGLPRQRLEKTMKFASQLPRLASTDRVPANRVPGCTAQVWLTAEVRDNGSVYFGADSDAEVVRGLCGVLVDSLNGINSEEFLSVSEDELAQMVEAVPKSTTWYTLLVHMQKRIRALEERRVHGEKFIPFPSLVITANDIQAQGAFAEAQVQYLTPNQAQVGELVEVLREKNIGVVAHFYMDPQVQGILMAAKKEWPHIHISDSLVMAEHAVKMAEVGCKHVAVLGVDFMSENVRAILDKNGQNHVRVYRMSTDRIGCSLAEAAQSVDYVEYLKAASRTPKSLHVIYINTSLETKAQAQTLVPTITCTSSNVLQTILQAFAQVPDLTLWYGPDSYMGANLAQMLIQLMSMTDEEIAKIHPAHNRKSIGTVLSHLQYYKDGTCIVHDLFGKEVVNKLRENYADAFMTAHLEVPGDMFTLAMDARAEGRGAVGSTQNILDFIRLKLREILGSGIDASPQFVLGTEAGMITSIVEAVRELLVQHELEKGPSASKVAAEIVFPVSTDAVASVSTSSSPSFQSAGLQIVPGVQSGEGCSVNGGCASCVYMKMNRLDRLVRVCRLVGSPGESLLAEYEPRNMDMLIGEQNIAELGCEPILNMRYFQMNKKLSSQLVDDILRHACTSVPT